LKEARAAQAPRKPKAARAASTLNSGESLYLQIARILKEEIISGIYPVGSNLQSEDVLAARFSVSRYTIREALRRLREDDLVSSRQGAGTVVTPPRHSVSYHVTSINDLAAFATGSHFTIHSIGLISIDHKLAARTGLASGEQWLEVRGARQDQSAEGTIWWVEYYINRKYAAIGRIVPRHTGPIYSLIEDMFGQSIVEVFQEIAGALISPELAGILRVDVGGAALEVRRIYRTADGEVAQVTINTHSASHFRHSMTMRREKS
jgi:DNA-binding GntR family transcriptional regulator